MPKRAVLAQYWVDYREATASFDSIPAALAYLEERSRGAGVIANKVVLDCGTVVLSQGDLERLIGGRRLSAHDILPSGIRKTDRDAQILPDLIASIHRLVGHVRRTGSLKIARPLIR